MKRIREREFTEHEYNRTRYLAERGELTFENGDKATGEAMYEDGRMWFLAIDKNGQEYETDEIPAERLPITIVVVEECRYIVID